MAEILVEKNKAIATVTLSNPGKMNVLSLDMWKALAETFHALSQDQGLRCVIIRGADGHFAAGADIEEFLRVRSTVEQAIHYHTEVIRNALQAIACCLHPTIAAIEGNCVGGGLEIACACDLRIASVDSRFGIPINRLGFPLAPDEMQGLLELVGKAFVLEILLEGRLFDAEEAKDKGLLHRITSDISRELGETAQRIASGAPIASRMNKKILRRLLTSSTAMTQNELQEIFSFVSSADYREGVQSFLAKRPPSFTGK